MISTQRRPTSIVLPHAVASLVSAAVASVFAPAAASASELERDFLNPPESAKPWVYWYFMDGHSSQPGMTADLESMKAVGIAGGIFLEVNVGVPRGDVTFMSDQWQANFVHAVREADRIGVQIAVGTGPGWCGTGGPWVTPDQSMQHLVSSSTEVVGPKRSDVTLPQPTPREPFFGLGSIPGSLKGAWQSFYSDVAVLAFPTPAVASPLADVGETALYHRAPFTSGTVAPFLPAPVTFLESASDTHVPMKDVIDLTDRLRADGTLDWEVPAGSWTILRFGRTTTGQCTRPAPDPGLGFETDKFDAAALDAHFDAFSGKLIKQIGTMRPGRGLTGLHFDSWEMSAQNWSKQFREQFKSLRGYDPLPYLPAMTGRTVGSAEITARFLWDLRQTTQELIYTNHVARLRDLSREHGLNFSSEPYDMNPAADLYTGSLADLPMGEFWSKGLGFQSEYSVFEATSIGHVMGRPIIGAEAFTADGGDAWKQHPASMKAQTDWALAAGINRIIFHRYQHQPEPVQPPGITMGPYGVHWERTQTWWDMVPAYHQYIARASHLLQQGNTVADILYLTPEGAPQVFRPPTSATFGTWQDRRGYNFDGVDPHILIDRAQVKGGYIVFEGGARYRVLVLPQIQTMTPKLLAKIKTLIEAGATVIGAAPLRSPSLADLPAGDAEVKSLASAIWGDASSMDHRTIGRGLLIPDRLPAQPPGTASDSAQWIWFDEGTPAERAPVASRHFQRDVLLRDDAEITRATLWMTADNSFEARVNGQLVGTGDDFHQRPSFDVTTLLKPGENQLAVVARNIGDDENPAGLIGNLHIEFKDGTTLDVPTDGEWRASTSADGETTPALVLGPAKRSPWNLNTTSFELYPHYDTTAAILRDLGLPPDFESDQPLRYTHRRDGDTDLYFIANIAETSIATTARFRVTGKQPEWWDPQTGTRRALPAFAMKDGITEIPLRLEPLQSAFIVFREATSATSGNGENHTSVVSVQTLDGPWQVTFDSKRGGPAEPVTFSPLADWSKHTNEHIRHYSGKAVYTLTFGATSTAATELSLGTVKNIASVRLNGKDLGVAWCAPWRVVIPPSVLKPTNNQLEVMVANLWINRLIFDSARPENERLTFSTYNPYNAASPLQPSGLLGPVELCAPEKR